LNQASKTILKCQSDATGKQAEINGKVNAKVGGDR